MASVALKGMEKKTELRLPEFKSWFWREREHEPSRWIFSKFFMRKEREEKPSKSPEKSFWSFLEKKDYHGRRDFVLDTLLVTHVVMFVAGAPLIGFGYVAAGVVSMFGSMIPVALLVELDLNPNRLREWLG